MSDQYLGEIRLWPCKRCPNQWHFCDGSALNISDYQALYLVIGTIYGGDGRTTFKLPDLRNNVPLHYGSGVGLTPRALAATGGADAVALTVAQMPVHTHAFRAATIAGDVSQINAGNTSALAAAGSTGNMVYYQTAGHQEVLTPLNTLTIGGGGNGLSHPNVMPTQTMNFIIALLGLFPSQG